MAPPATAQAERVRLGITLPIFSADAARVFGVARAAEAKGIDGVFVFDHLWPMGDPKRPALSAYPTAAAALAVTEHISVGTLVARVGLLPDAVVLASLQSLAIIGGHRLIAGLGTGDAASEPEHERMGIPYFSPSARRESLASIARSLTAGGVECWVGAGAKASNEIARAVGATLNFWDVPATRVSQEVAAGHEVSWGGPLPPETQKAGALLRELADAGATWIVWGWPKSLDAVLEAKEAAGL